MEESETRSQIPCPRCGSLQEDASQFCCRCGQALHPAPAGRLWIPLVICLAIFILGLVVFLAYR